MSKTYEEIVQELDSKIPRDVIEQRDGGGGRKLSYLPGHYVIDRLNKVIGQGNWGYDSNINLLFSGVIQDKYGNDVNTVHYSGRVTLVVTIDGRQVVFTDYGYGDGTDKTNPGKAHELAIKEAVTDGLKRCAKNLGMSMGLALYDKTQENVADEEPKPSPVRTVEAPKPSPAPVPNTQPSPPAGDQKAQLTDLIGRYIKVARAQKKSEQTKEHFAKVGVASPDDLTKLTIEQLVISKNYLEELTK